MTTVSVVPEAVPAGYTVPAARSRERAERKHSTAHTRKLPNSSTSASVPLAIRCAAAQVFTLSSIGWPSRAFSALRGT